jgi:PAS domain S-box-containing protein
LRWIARSDGTLIWLNERGYSYAGADRDENPTAVWENALHPDDRQAMAALWQAAVGSGTRLEMSCRLRQAADGEFRWHLARAVPAHDIAGKIENWYGTATDIHALTQDTRDAAVAAEKAQARLSLEARKAERERAQQLNFNRGITDSLALGLYAVDLQGHATFVNPAAEALLGYTAEELLGRDMHEVIHFQHCDHAAFPKDACPLLGVLQTGKLIRVDDDCFTTRMGKLLPVSYSSAPITEDGKVVGAVVSFQDITERRKHQEILQRYSEELENRVYERTLELREANGRLAASNRELQDFASVASHDLQEPLRKIQAFGDRLATRSAGALGPEGADYLNRMKNAAGRMQTLISDLLQFSRVTTKAQPFSPVNLADIAREVMADLESALEKNGGEVEFGNLPSIDADPVQMRQLFQNLIGNALKFRKPDVKSVVCIGAQIILQPVDGASPLETCQLMISDNGIGFDEKYLDRIFNVFQRLHGRTEYEGTGIGLAVCRKIVERHGGSITARSAPGSGSTFIVNLPVHHALAASVTPAGVLD